MKFGSLCALGGFTPYPVLSALEHFPEDFGGAPRSPSRRSRAHDLDPRDRSRHPGRARDRRRWSTLTIDGRAITVPAGTSVMRAAALLGTDIPKLCATDSLKAFGSCRLCLVEIEGRAGTPASCTTPVAPGMVVRTQTDELKKLRTRGDGALYLRSPARLPDLRGQRRLRAAGQADAVGLRDVRYGYEGANHLGAGQGRSPTPISTSIPPSASSARAACARATRSRARSR